MTEAPAHLYFGQVMHARMKPVAHRFTYQVFTLLLDLDRLDEADCQSPLFSIGRFNLVSFFESDHLPAGRTSLRGHVDQLLAKAGLETRCEKIKLMCYPRILGFVFNPISVYYGYGASGMLSAMIYEVRNTFGQKHTYVAPVREDELWQGGVRQKRSKLFYVSPFMDMVMTYKFRLNLPGPTLTFRILEEDGEGPILAATYAAQQKPLSTALLAWAFVSLPLLTLKVVAAIHWEAAKLWVKGMRLRHRPPAPAAASFLAPGSDDKNLPILMD